MIKLTRLNQHTIAINPDHISFVDETPDTTLFLIGGEKLIVRETLDELINAVIAFRRHVRHRDDLSRQDAPDIEGDPPRVGVVQRRNSSEQAAVRSQPAAVSTIPHNRGER